MEEKKDYILETLENDLKQITTEQQLIELKSKYLGKKGLVTELTSNMRELTEEQRREVGAVAGEVRSIVTEKINALSCQIQ